MQHRTIHFFDDLDVGFLVIEWTGLDDLAAMDQARKLAIRHAVEVWQGDRRVARVNRAYAPMRAEDRQCLK